MESTAISRTGLAAGVGLVPLLIVALCCLAPGVAAAGGQQDPARALFGQTPETPKPMSLISASVFGGSGTSLAGDGGSEDRATTGKYSTGLNGTLSHVRRGRAYTFNAGLGTTIWYFPARHQVQTIERSARVSFATSLGKRNRLAVSQTLLYSPFRQFGGIADSDTDSTFVLPSASPDSAAAEGAPSYDLGTAVSLAHEFSSLVGLGLSYTTRWHHGEAADSLLTHRGGVSLRVGLGRSAALVFGTATRFGRSTLRSQSATAQEFDVGIDFNRPLSLSRGTTLTVNTGMALVSLAGTSEDPAALGRRVRMIGTVAFNRTLNRQWVARLAYERNVRFIEGFPAPFYAHAVAGRMNGQFGRRFNIFGQADYSTGKSLDSSPDGSDQFFRGFQTQMRMTAALSRWVQLYAEHNYSENELSTAALANLAPGIVPRRYSRGVRVGLALWSPRVH